MVLIKDHFSQNHFWFYIYGGDLREIVLKWNTNSKREVAFNCHLNKILVMLSCSQQEETLQRKNFFSSDK